MANISINLKTKDFQKSLQATTRRVRYRTMDSLLETVRTIAKDTLQEVPKSTTTLANSFGYKVKASSAAFTAELGYGRNGDPVNPITGNRASEYMVAVHEDLDAVHPIGKAKYFEDPLNRHEKTLTENFIKGFNNAVK